MVTKLPVTKGCFLKFHDVSNESPSSRDIFIHSFAKFSISSFDSPITGKFLIVPAWILKADFVESMINLPTQDCKKHKT